VTGGNAVILVVVEHDRGTLAPATLEALTAARGLAATAGLAVQALTIGAAADGLVGELAVHGAEVVHQAHHEMLRDYGPEAWGEVLAQAVRVLAPSVVIACGTDRGNEVMAQAAARLDLPFVANCVELSPGSPDGPNSINCQREAPDTGRHADSWSGPGQPFGVVRARWGGSLLEVATVEAAVTLLSVAHHAFAVPAAAPACPAGPPAAGAADVAILPFTPSLDPSLARSVITARVERAAGVTLATARVVVGGGRGVGSREGFAPLEDLAGMLGGVVGCSRAVTNNGWRNHTDQVGQTGTRIAPTIYLACGISGAVQHWVGAMASKTILAINTDPEANMVSKAGYAVIGDLHEVVPAICTEIRRRRGGA
jgi:electron transfer flavoprotein alpha subunit